MATKAAPPRAFEKSPRDREVKGGPKEGSKREETADTKQFGGKTAAPFKRK